MYLMLDKCLAASVLRGRTGEGGERMLCSSNLCNNLVLKTTLTLTVGDYVVWVKTHGDSKPSHDSAVIFTAYGDKGKSRDIELTADKPVFQPGNTDQFQVITTLAQLLLYLDHLMTYFRLEYQESVSKNLCRHLYLRCHWVILVSCTKSVWPGCEMTRDGTFSRSVLGSEVIQNELNYFLFLNLCWPLLG